VSTGVFLIFVAAMLWWGLWWLLVTFTDSTVPVADAFTTALSIVGLWMMARKYVEQWLVWFVVDIVCCGLYLFKGLYFYCGLYGIYTIISSFGYNKWLKMMKEQLIQRQNKS
jgi:nicotinamide mononucleotide transporter